MSESFATKQRFLDSKNYPRGFSRHGDFSIKEASLLEKFGHAFRELSSGQRAPLTEDEKHFILVCKREEPPATENEKVWLKYLEKVSKPKKFHTLSGGKLQSDSLDDFGEVDD